MCKLGGDQLKCDCVSYEDGNSKNKIAIIWYRDSIALSSFQVFQFLIRKHFEGYINILFVLTNDLECQSPNN